MKEGTRLLRRAFDLGINFWDTDESYGSHPSIREALKGLDRAQVVIAAKTYKSDRGGARQSLERALQGLGTDQIDIFLLHAIDSASQFERYAGALEVLLKARENGQVRAVGLSTHTVEMMEATSGIRELEVVLTVLNRTGAGIRGGGSRKEMEGATRRACESGKGVYLMKVMARKELAGDPGAAMRYALGLRYVHSVCVGMRNIEELEMNVAMVHRHDYSSL